MATVIQRLNRLAAVTWISAALSWGAVLALSADGAPQHHRELTHSPGDVQYLTPYPHFYHGAYRP